MEDHGDEQRVQLVSTSTSSSTRTTRILFIFFGLLLVIMFHASNYSFSHINQTASNVSQNQKTTVCNL